MTKNALVLISLAIAAILIIAAVSLRAGKTEPLGENGDNITTLGAAGSEHSHMRMLVFVRGELVDFGKNEYMLKSKLVHFEPDGSGRPDGLTIHKHASGVTLPYFFQTLGMGLTGDCLISDDAARYCSDAKNRLSIYVNGALWNDKIEKYELRRHDKILINYGDEEELDLRLRINAIPDLGPDL